jgi:hypothetical protein
MDTRNFTGVFIPAHIWLHKDLIPAEKMLLGEISALQMKTGWCHAGRNHFAEWLNVEPQTITYYTKKLQKMGFLEVVGGIGVANKMRVNPERFMVEDQPVSHTDPSAGLTAPVSRTDYHPSAGLTLNKSLNKSLNSNTHSQSEKPKLEAEKKETPPVPAAPLFSHSHKPTDLNTHFDLFDQMGEYYKANPNEWKFRVREVLPNRYTDEQLKSMLADYCAHAFADRNKYATFAAHHAKFCTWVKQQPGYERKTQPQYTPAKKSHRPEINENYKPKSEQLW